MRSDSSITEMRLQLLDPIGGGLIFVATLYSSLFVSS